MKLVLVIAAVVLAAGVLFTGCLSILVVVR